ncbi:Aste57867_2422 [Aphanomyces stellatus]|uniref:Aste57867_2422 protein n=1 Tax=Aphanomyces stellatus TaxID=120398 RepID=A0A485KD72_9STRA|nr:hypothetical protein As57867_002416 [Aphanomyces stellatus]VFT79623.1 Aste57867_2422 [Aphanomyces stellatus]
MVYLDSPAGVGFSKPLLNASDYNNDVTTARIFEFLGVFFDKYPSYQRRPFYVTGESYNGFYIPYLVHLMVTKPNPIVPLAGFVIGNAYTDRHIDGKAYYDWIYSHALISSETYRALLDHCGDQVSECASESIVCSSACQAALNEAHDSVDMAAMNQFFIYSDVCLLKNRQNKFYPYHRIRAGWRGTIGPCADTFTQSYLRLPEVQVAIHVQGELVEWSQCAEAVQNMYMDSQSALPKYPIILNASLKVLIYSGDADSNTNFIGTERWLTTEGLKLGVTTPWQSWFGPDKQLAGYTQGYRGLNFTTIKGAGHMVPAIRPLHALYMIECFIHGDDACNGKFDYPKDNLEYVSGVGDFVTTAAITTGEWLALVLPFVVALLVISSYAWFKDDLCFFNKA